MPIRMDNSNIDGVYFGGQEIERVYYGSHLVYGKELPLPVAQPIPLQYTEELVNSVSGPTHKIYKVTEDGFFKVKVKGSDSSIAYVGSSGPGGYIETIVFLYRATQCLMWGSTIPNTGYPEPTDALGGRGAYITYGNGERGGPGGGAAGNGARVYSTGGGGSGFLAGINRKVQLQTHKEEPWTKEITSRDSWAVGAYSVKYLYVYVLASGAGGPGGDEHTPRGSAGAGGAWGNGGSGPVVANQTAGPGGTWGKGADGQDYGTAGVPGAFAVLDFSKDVWNAGISGSYGAGSQAAGYVNLIKLIRTSVILTLDVKDENATVILSADGTSQQWGNNIEVLPGTTVTYLVTKEGYIPQTETIVLNEDRKIVINLAVNPAEKMDLGLVTEPVDKEDNLGLVTEAVTEIKDLGGLW